MYQDLCSLDYFLHALSHEDDRLFKSEFVLELSTKLQSTSLTRPRLVKMQASTANPDLVKRHLKCDVLGRNFGLYRVVGLEGHAEKISYVAKIQRKGTKGSLDKALALKSAKKYFEDGHHDKISDLNAAKQHVPITARNNHACKLFIEGEIEESLSVFHTLFKEVTEVLEVNEEREREIQRNPSPKDLFVRHPLQNESEMFYFLVLIINYANASMCGQNYDVIPVLNDVVQGNPPWFNENPMLKRFVVVILAQILVTGGKRKKAFVIFDLQSIDGLAIQRDVDESPLAIFYIKEACHILTQRGERKQAKHLLEVALKSCKETYQDLFLLGKQFFEQRKRNPPALKCLVHGMVKQRQNKVSGVLLRREEHSDTEEKVMKLFACPLTLSRTASPSSCSPGPICRVIGPRSNPAFQKTMCFRKGLLLVDGHPEYLVLQGSQVKGLENLRIVFPRPQVLLQKTLSMTVVTEAEDILSIVHPFLKKKAWLSRSPEDMEHIIASLILLLEELVAFEKILANLYECICLLYNVAEEKSEESNEVELYKDCFGKFSYFISFDTLHMPNEEIPLTVVVLCRGKDNGEEDVTSKEKPVFRKFAFQERKCQNGDEEKPTGFGYMVFLQSLNLLDINDLRQLKESIIQGVKVLENPSINVSWQGSVFIEFVPGINLEKLPQQSLQLRLIAPLLMERDGLVLSGPIPQPSVQYLYLQQFQKRFTLKNDLDLDVFTTLFQYTYCSLRRIVDVLCKAKKKMVCLMREPPFSVLTLHTKENTMYLTIQDVVDTRSYGDSIPAHGAIQLIDSIAAECYEKLGISRSDLKEGWRGLSGEEIDDSTPFCDAEDTLEKAFKTNDRLTKELQYLKEKNQKLTARARKLLDQLSEMERRASLLQDHFVQTITSDSDRTKAAEKWIAEKGRQEYPQEGPRDDEDLELEELLESLSNDKLAEFLAESKRPDFMSKDETSDHTRKKYSSDNKPIVQQETIEGAVGKSFDQKMLKAPCVKRNTSPGENSRLHPLEVFFDERGASNLSSSDGKRIVQEETLEGKSSSRPSWLLPSPESSPVSSSSDIAAKETETTVLMEAYTQTDSLGFIQEYKDVIVQTDPVQLNEEESMEKGLAEFKRDCAERKLRKLRLSQDVHAFKARSRQTTPGSHDSIASFSRDYISSGSLPEPYLSKVSSNETESEHSEESSQYSNLTKTSGFFSEGTAPTSSSSSQSSISSQASSHGTEGILSIETTLDSITLEYSEPLHTLHSSIPSQESSSLIEIVAGEERPQDSSTLNSLPDPWPCKSSSSREPSNRDVQSNVKGTNNSEKSESHDGNDAVTVSSFGSREFVSLHEVRNDEIKFESTTPLLPSNLQQDDKNEACLSTIKETDDAGDANTGWTSQGARPKRKSPLRDDDDYHDEYIVSGVDSSFLARHSRDTSLTRSVYSQVPANRLPFISLPNFNQIVEVSSTAKTWPDCVERRLPEQYDPSVFDDKSRQPYQVAIRRETVRFQDRDADPCKEQKEVPLPKTHSDVATGRLPLPGSQSDVPTGTVPLPKTHSDVATGRLPLPGSQSDVPTGTVPLPKTHSDAATGRLPLPGSQSDVPTGTVLLSKSHSVVATGRLPLPGSQSDVPTGTVPLPKSHSVVATGRLPLPGSQSDIATTISRSTSNRVSDYSPTKDTDSLSDDDDSYKTADDSFSSLDSLEDQVKRSKMTWSQMSASAMFETELDHDDDEDEEENQTSEMQTENRREEGKNLERTEGRARKTDLGGATSSSPRKDFARREQTVRTTGLTSTEQMTAQRVSAEVIDAKERELRLVREREREQRLKREVEENKRRLEASQRQREQKPPSTPQPARLPVQESASEWPCSHYKRRCEIKFPCCEEFYYCHRCHNESDSCPKDDKKALHGTHLRCLVCLTEQEITENSHHCVHCKTQLSEYFCGICKHFTGNEKKPYHCKPCGICRIHSDRSFHCEVCNVCLDERLRNNHICRPDSGHDECCICLEDAFGGCQILPCSHKVHRECAIAMLQNGVRKCPVCRHPLNQSMQRGQSS